MSDKSATVTVEHTLKCWPGYFAAILDGRKTFEVRKDDRGFQSGDRVRLREWNPDAAPTAVFAPNQGYTGREITARIGYVLHSAPRGRFETGFSFGDFVVFSLLDVQPVS